MSNRFPGRRLSKLRLGILVIVLLGLTGGSYLGLRSFQDANAASSIPSVFSGYVDVTATPRFAFESPNSAEAKGAVLSFIVSDLKNACTPSWGTAYGLAEAESALDLDRRIARLRQIGGTVSVSFGGLTNSELAVGCTDQSRLTSAYREVVERTTSARSTSTSRGPPSRTPPPLTGAPARWPLSSKIARTAARTSTCG